MPLRGKVPRDRSGVIPESWAKPSGAGGDLVGIDTAELAGNAGISQHYNDRIIDRLERNPDGPRE